MRVLRFLGKYAGYYIISSILISMFVGAAFKAPLYTISGAAIAVSFFSAVFQLILGGCFDNVFEQISTWCIRGTFILVVFMSMAGIGFNNIIKMFTG